MSTSISISEIEAKVFRFCDGSATTEIFGVHTCIILCPQVHARTHTFLDDFSISCSFSFLHFACVLSFSPLSLSLCLLLGILYVCPSLLSSVDSRCQCLWWKQFIKPLPFLSLTIIYFTTKSAQPATKKKKSTIFSPPWKRSLHNCVCDGFFSSSSPFSSYTPEVSK